MALRDTSYWSVCFGGHFSFSLVAILWAQNVRLTQRAHCTLYAFSQSKLLWNLTFGSLKMSFYSSIYFYSDQSLSTVPKSRCALRGPFEAGQEVEVKWAGQRFIGIILKTADKGKFLCFKLYLRLVLFFLLPCSTYVALSFGGPWTGHDCLKTQKSSSEHVYLESLICLTNQLNVVLEQFHKTHGCVCRLRVT